MHAKLLAVILALASTVGNAADLCDSPMTDLAQKECVIRELAVADKKLNEVYGKLYKLLDNEGRIKLKEAQRAWLKFRDLNAEFAGDVNRGGSAESLNILGAKTMMTRERIKELESEYEVRK